MRSPAAKPLYAGYRFPAEVISQAVWLYFRFPLSLCMAADHLAHRLLPEIAALRAAGASSLQQVGPWLASPEVIAPGTVGRVARRFGS
jgi:hypothetical protein